MFPIYTFGYANFTVEQLKAKALELNAIVVDTRFKPFSRVPEWNVRKLAAALEAHDVPYVAYGTWFGNVNYKNGGPIQLADPMGAKAAVLGMLSQRPIVLLCQCWSWATCHRNEVAKLVQTWSGSDVIHLVGKDLPKKMKPNVPAGGGGVLSLFDEQK
jgi:hypothetical protein